MSALPYVLVNFGGPRNLDEVTPFLISLLSDQEVIRSSLPSFLHRALFTRVAKKRAKKVKEDYAFLGGGSPIFGDTEAIANKIREKSSRDVIAFHRYLPATHSAFFKAMQSLPKEGEIDVVPLFPQFSYATTGSIALFFQKHLPGSLFSRMKICRSYCTHPGYIEVMQKQIREYLQKESLAEEEIILLFSAHGLPQEFIDTGDPYQKECEESYQKIAEHFPSALTFLSYQSQFGPKPWILPYTSHMVEKMKFYAQGRKEVVIVPLSFPSDHIETLFEIETAYLPPLRKEGFCARRCPALNRREDWIDVLVSLFTRGEKDQMNSILRR